MRGTKKKAILNSLIIVMVTIVFTGGLLLSDLGAPLISKVYATENATTETTSEILHNATLRTAGSNQNVPTITVLNHGYNGGAGAWYEDSLVDEVRNSTLTEKLRTTLTADVYIIGLIGRDANGDEQRIYKQHGNGYIDSKYDAGNDRYVDENGNGKTVQEIEFTE
jgi:hypothetical protein